MVGSVSVQANLHTEIGDVVCGETWQYTVQSNDTAHEESSSELKYEWLAIRRVLLFAGCLVLTMGCILLLHQVERNHILYDPIRDDRMFGAMAEADLRKAEEKQRWINPCWKV